MLITNNQTGPRKIKVLMHANYYTITRHQYVLRNVLERSSKKIKLSSLKLEKNNSKRTH